MSSSPDEIRQTVAVQKNRLDKEYGCINFIKDMEELNQISFIHNFSNITFLKDGNKVLTYSGIDPLTNKKVIIKTIKHSEDIGVSSKEDLSKLNNCADWDQEICTIESHKKYTSLYSIGGIVDIEISKLRELNHPNISSIKAFGRTKWGQIAVVSDFNEGIWLQEMIDQAIKDEKPIPEDQCLNIFAQIMLALDFAHEKDISHKNVRPKNVYLSDDLIVKLTDFTITPMDDNTVGVDPIFTKDILYYLPPEIYDERPYTKAGDVWSAGILLYKMCSRQFPIETDNYYIYMSEMIDFAIPIKIFEWSDDLNRLCWKILRRDPDERPTVKDILEEPIVKEKAVYYRSKLEKSSSVISTSAKTYSSDEYVKLKQHYEEKIKNIVKQYKKMLDEKDEEIKGKEETKDSNYTSTSTGIGTSWDTGPSDFYSTDSHYGYFAPSAQELGEFKSHIDKIRNNRKAGYTSFEHLSLNLDLKQIWTFELLKSLTEDILLPVFVKEIDIKYLDIENQYVKDFLSRLETEIDELLVNVYCLPKYEGDDKLDFSEYEEPLQHAISRVRRNVFLHNFEISWDQFSSVRNLLYLFS